MKRQMDFIGSDDPKQVNAEASGLLSTQEGAQYSTSLENKK